MENNNKEVSMMDMMGEIEKSMKRIHEGEIVKGNVISVSEEEIMVNIGYMADGIINKEEINNNDCNLKDTIKSGDEIYVYIIKVNDGEGNVLLSKKKADEIKTWDKLEKDFKLGTVYDVIVKEIVKGGAVTYINEIRAFIPASHLSYSYVKDLSSFLNYNHYYLSLLYYKNKRRVILSAKELEKEQIEKSKEQFWKSLQKGEKRSGVVTRLAKFGAFVDLGGVEGLIHLNDLSWKRVNNPSEVVSIGDKVQVYVLDFDNEKNKISLGLKDVEQDPWKDISAKYKIGDIVEGKVVKNLDFGVIVQLEDGIEGLVHISEISEERILKPSDVIKLNDRVKVKIIEINEENRKLSLSIKNANNILEEEISKYNDKSEALTLGDLFKDKLRNMKLE
ncbi:30S ribosomal protein S1 [Clostridium tetanomorphum DSM 665]|nr:30S ribosomal protein S1 [Clostridium tetanomorphum DSM 665]